MKTEVEVRAGLRVGFTCGSFVIEMHACTMDLGQEDTNRDNIQQYLFPSPAIPFLSSAGTGINYC